MVRTPTWQCLFLTAGSTCFAEAHSCDKINSTKSTYLLSALYRRHRPGAEAGPLRAAHHPSSSAAQQRAAETEPTQCARVAQESQAVRRQTQPGEWPRSEHTQRVTPMIGVVETCTWALKLMHFLLVLKSSKYLVTMDFIEWCRQKSSRIECREYISLMSALVCRGLWMSDCLFLCIRQIINTYTEAVQTVDPIKATGKPHSLWVSFARFYEDNEQLDDVSLGFCLCV